MGGPTPRRWSGRGRVAVLAGAGACAGACAVILGSVGLSAAARAGGANVPDDDVGYVGGPSYLDPSVTPYVVPGSVESFAVPAVELISRRSEIPGDVSGGIEPSISGDGRYVVFTAPVAGSDTQTTVLVRDRATGELYEVTPALPEFPGRSSRGGAISEDGCAVAVATTTPYDVFRDRDSGSRWDVYRVLMPQCSDNPDEGGGEWELMSSPIDGDPSALDVVDPTAPIGVSADGTVVAFRVVFPERFAGPDPVGSVLVADATVALGAKERVVAAPGVPANPAGGQFRVAGQGAPALSADGRFVAFVSDAQADQSPPAWADGPTPGGAATAQVYVWDRTGLAGGPRLVSMGATGEPLARGADQPAISGDGRYVAYVANATTDAAGGLSGNCDDCPANVFVIDRDTDGNGTLDEAAVTAVRAVSAKAGLLGDADSSGPSFALDGRLIGYVTRARNLVPGPLGSAGVFVTADTVTNEITAVSMESGGPRPAAVVSGRAALSQSGRSAVFETTAPGVLGASVVTGGDTQIVAITSTPAVRIDDIDVGTTLVNAQTQRSTTVTNAGPGAFVPASIASTSPAFLVSGGTCQVGTPVAAGESCTVDLLFSAATLGFASTQLVVSEQGIAAVSVAASITGSGGVPKIEAEPPTVVFAEALVGSAGETLSVVIRNVGNGPTVMSAAALGGTHPGDYLIESDGCSGGTVPDLGACTIRVAFRPLSSGVRSSVLIVTTLDGAVARATLSGRGAYQPSISLGASSVEAGGRVRVAGVGFPADTEVSIAWEGSETAPPVRTDVNGAFDVKVGTAGVVPGVRRVVVSDGVPIGATPRYAALRSDGVRIAEANSGVDAGSPVFD